MGLNLWRQEAPRTALRAEGHFFFLNPCCLQPRWAPGTCHPGPTTLFAPHPDNRTMGLGALGTRTISWSYSLVSVRPHTRWISNSFTSVSYQMGGSTFLK